MVLACLSARGVSYLALWPITVFLDNWCLIQLIFMIPTSFLFFTFSTSPESPRWLLATERISEAKTVIFRAARKNRINVLVVKRRWELLLTRVLKGKQKSAGCDAPKWETIEKYQTFKLATILMFSWLVSWFVYYSLTPSAGKASTDPLHRASKWLDASVALLAFLLAASMADRLRRTRCSALEISASGILSLPAIALAAFQAPHAPAFLLLLSNVLVTAATSVLYLYTLEVFPTVIRNTGLNACTICESLGGVIVSLAPVIAEASFAEAPYGVFSALCIIAGALVLTLPQTVHET